MATLTALLLDAMVVVVAVTLIYAAVVLTLDRLIEELPWRMLVQLLVVLGRTAGSVVRMAVAYIVVRHRLRHLWRTP